MIQDYYVQASADIEGYKQTREIYKKQFWLHSKSMDHERRKQIKSLFMKIDRLRNHIALWLKHLVSNKPSNYDEYMQLIERGKAEIDSSFKQLDQALHRA